MSASNLFYILSGLALLVIGAQFLVRGSSRLAVAMGISPLVVGLTVVAMGTSVPELAVSVQSCLARQTNIVMGNVVGANIYNVLFILGVCAVITPMVVAPQLIRLRARHVGAREARERREDGERREPQERRAHHQSFSTGSVRAPFARRSR